MPPSASKTRSGKNYSIFQNAVPFHCPGSFNFVSLLQEATEKELASEDFDDHSETLHEGRDNQPALPASETPFLSSLSPPRTPTASESSHSLHTPYRLKRTSKDPQTLDNARRKCKRAMKIAQSGHQACPSTVKKVVQASTPASVSADFAKFPAAAGAYQAKFSQPKVPRLLAADVPHSAASLSTQGFRYLPWNGIRPFFDKAGRLIALLGGRPKDPTYLSSTNAVFDLMMQEGLEANFHPKLQRHRRGHFAALNIGVSHGKGTHHPINLDNHEHAEMVARLLASKHVQ
ncbi:hypothetical protein M413DRAFT_32678 [Hebeloma cylindrosporum]|uniref:Uncharacterized protein n=1 Tax=Hebeloma cylindrosporum TaxID=76867 RepID=A0A0C2Y296_HEBCY|nr:hypothetical protein M413DRAFT_32678 [Hebeloma cylindrosporum h7]